MKSLKATPKNMFERMVQTSVEEQTGAQVFASGIAYNENCEMWFFRCEAIGDDGDGNKAFLTCDGYIGTLGRVVITDTKYLRVEVA